MMKKKNPLNYQLYLQREQSFRHQPYSNELSFYTAVKNGNLAFIQKLKEQYPPAPDSKEEILKNYDPNGKGILSKNPVRNERYHLIVNTALITRNCIEGGLSQEIAYTLSDMFIRRADETEDICALRKLNDEMVWEFTKKMLEFRTQTVNSSHIKKCIQYIYDNLHTPLTVQKLSQHLKLHPSYLSTLFKKETGYSIHAFIQNTRLETARNMLLDTEYSCAGIANTLCFSSQSHFIRLFREKYGMTPAKYRTINSEPKNTLPDI